ncbi:pyridoxal phosphate-dependent aminotransferase [Parasedimentitalea huanghaiensis]|uniref:aspartate transaminase n=1 Tax=Parasedimentitalea huanghaiensis TaxID=2682100 RepID=A0A6L6WF36_9RHOB|nr:pyridoxal phosphate-dependent aminotransferase [Zongyanglinia huanghaiensis]MVO14627.1 aminotransferase class I/II-fold pyridoxal phosphate-dependent enzyme [Zongyanglinia huanghaiensis]
MLLSQRITHLNTNGTDGWEVFVRARSMKAAGLPVVELTIGEHDIRTQTDILEAMHVSAMNGHTGYAMVPGTDQLRDTIAKRVSLRTGVPTDRDNVLITPGGQSALFAAHIALCDPGDRALYLDPYYATYPGTIRGTGAQDIAIQTHSRDAFLPQQALLDAAAPDAKSLLINTPNNPTGVVYPKETIEMIAGVCQRHDLWLISDEVYDTQIWQGEHVSPRALPGMAERTLVIGSMSKSHAMTGSRCGWIIGPKEVIAHLIHLATHTTYGVPGFIQDAADYALKQGADLEVDIAEPFRRRRALALKVLSQQALLRVIPPQGAMYLMLDVRETGHSGSSFANLLLETHNIAVMPGESFGRAAAGHIRIAMTVDDNVFVTALQVLCDFAQSLGK